MTVPIIIVAGQVNAARPDLIAGLTGHAAQNGAIVVNFAVNGSPLSPILDRGTGDWNAGGGAGEGELLAQLDAQIADLTDPASPNYIQGAYVASVVWVHGENDVAHPTAATNYGADLVALRDHMVELFGPHDWVVSTLSSDPFGNNSGSVAAEANWITVRDAQLGLAQVDGFTVIDPDQVAMSAELPLSEAFIAGNLHYSADFQPLLLTAITQALPLLSGDANVLVGTSSMDWLAVEGGQFSYVLGGGGADTADFGALTHAINVRAGDGAAIEVSARHGDRDFGADLIDVERVQGTAFDDYFETTEDIHVVLAGAGNDRVVGGTYEDRAILGAGNDRAFGDAGNDFFRGNEGNDRLRGGDGDDALWGDEGDDYLQGGAGDDLLVGGAGNDRIDPNHGADVIVFRRGDSGVDRVNGFDDREDVLSFEGLGLEASDFEFEVEGRHLHITVDGHGVSADITLINRGQIDPGSLDTSVDWIVF